MQKHIFTYTIPPILIASSFKSTSAPGLKEEQQLDAR